MEAFGPDPKAISLEQLAGWIGEKRLTPGRSALREAFPERIDALERTGIRDLSGLLKSLGSREKTAALSRKTGIPEAFLVLLKREASSYLPRPLSLARMEGLPLEFIRSLESRGIRNSRQFLEASNTPEDTLILSQKSGIPLGRLDQIRALCDLVRITGVGGSFARIVYDSGIRSVKEFARTDPDTHARLYREAWEKYGLPGFPPGAGDIEYALHYARVLEDCTGQGSS